MTKLLLTLLGTTALVIAAFGFVFGVTPASAQEWCQSGDKPRTISLTHDLSQDVWQVRWGHPQPWFDVSAYEVRVHIAGESRNWLQWISTGHSEAGAALPYWTLPSTPDALLSFEVRAVQRLTNRRCGRISLSGLHATTANRELGERYADHAREIDEANSEVARLKEENGDLRRDLNQLRIAYDNILTEREVQARVELWDGGYRIQYSLDGGFLWRTASDGVVYWREHIDANGGFGAPGPPASITVPTGKPR